MKKLLFLSALLLVLAGGASASPLTGFARIAAKLPQNLIFYDKELHFDGDPAITLNAIPQSGSTGHSVGLTWTPGAADATHDPATSFNIKRALITGGPYTTIGTSTTPSYTDLSVTAGTKYFYVVTDVNSGGESAPSNEASALVPSFPPAPPSGLSGTPK